MSFQVRILDEEKYDAWDQMVYATPGGSIFSTAEYLDVLCSNTGDSFRIAAIVRDNAILGGIALYEIGGRWGTVVRPRFLLPYNGLVYSTGESDYPSRRESMETKLQSALAEFVEQKGYASVLLKNRASITDIRVFSNRGWQAIPTYTYVVNCGDLDNQWRKVDRNLKRLIKRCGSGEFEITDDDDFDSFFALHSQVHERKGAPLYLPPDRFKAYFSELRGKGLARLLHARTQGGQAVASQIVLTGRHTFSHSIAAGSDEQYTNSGVNAFLRWKAFENLASLGFQHNDLTDASLNSVSRFKSQLGGELQMSFALAHPETPLHRIGSRLEAGARKLKGMIINE